MRIVVDTNVVFEGLTQSAGSARTLVDLWLAGDERFEPCVSNALAYEYADVLSRKLAEERWRTVRPQLRRLLQEVTFIVPYFSWRPSSNDPGDEHVIECALNAWAALVTFNLRDFRTARYMYKLPVLTPAQFLTDYLNQEE